MKTVGICTLKNHRSEYVRAVQSGERVTVISRGTSEQTAERRGGD